jgi:predicted HTH transcriptional regulator
MQGYIQKLIAEGEHQQLDFKFGITDSRKIARSLAAFANTDGGRLLIGVKDNGAIAGVRTGEEYYMVQAASELYTRPEVKFEVKEWQVEGRAVLEIIVQKSQAMPHSAPDKDGNWKVYIRVKDHNYLANSIWLRVLRHHKTDLGTLVEYTEKERLLITYLSDHEKITLSKFIKLAGISRKKAENLLVNFISLSIVKMEFTENGVFYSLAKQYSNIG